MAASSIAIAGCGSSGSSGPDGVVKEYASALSDGDTEKIESLTHQDAPGLTPQGMGGGFGSQVEISASNIRTIDRDLDVSADHQENVQAFEAVEFDLTTTVEIGE